MNAHRRESQKNEHASQEALYDRIAKTGGFDSVVIHVIDCSGEAAALLEAEMLAESLGEPECLNCKLERSDRPDAVRMRAYYAENRARWNEYNRRKQAERRAQFRNS